MAWTLLRFYGLELTMIGLNEHPDLGDGNIHGVEYLQAAPFFKSF